MREKVDSGVTKELFCSDCIIKKKFHEPKKSIKKNSKDFLKENKS